MSLALDRSICDRCCFSLEEGREANKQHSECLPTLCLWIYVHHRVMFLLRAASPRHRELKKLVFPIAICYFVDFT